MQNGLYKVEFQTPLGAGAGVVYLENGKLHGGDSAMFYIGKVSEQGEDLVAEVESKRHTQGMQSVFGIDHTHITLKGRASNNTAAALTGSAKEAPNVALKAKLVKISD
jgi:hypothetical protein